MAKPHDNPNDTKARLAGIGLVAVGAFLFKLGFLDVLRAAEAHAPSVSTSTKAVGVAPGFALLGLLLVVIGAPGDGSAGPSRYIVNASDRRLKPLGWLIVAVVFAPGLVLWLWLSARLRELGYD